MNRPCALALVLCSLVWTTPLFGATLTVNAGGNLQAAIDAAQPGDTILLQAGATFTGPFTLRAKNGTAYITIRSSTPDCSCRRPARASRRLTRGCWRRFGRACRFRDSNRSRRELLAAPVPGGPAQRVVGWATVGTLIEFGSAGSINQSSLSQVPHHLVIDRCYVHGHPSLGHRRGLALNSANSEVRESLFLRLQAPGLRHTGDPRLERAGAVPDREQPSRGCG